MNNPNRCPVLYYIKDTGFVKFESQSSAGRRFKMTAGAVNMACAKSANQTIEEFLNDKAKNKFIKVSDEKTEALINMFEIIE